MRHNSRLHFGHVKLHCLYNYENQLELEFLIKINFQRQRKNETSDAEYEEGNEPDAPKRWAKKVLEYSISCVNFTIK